MDISPAILNGALRAFISTTASRERLAEHIAQHRLSECAEALQRELYAVPATADD